MSLALDETLAVQARARVGSILRGKWRLERLLGVGGMAAVYAARHRNGNRVAIKLLHAERSADRSIHARFLREGFLANAVHHSNVVRVLDEDVTDDGAAFLVMDLIEGETVDARAVRKGGTLPIEEVFAIVDGVLDVLQTAHAAGIFHRDIKPGNVMITLDGRVTLLDFGIAHDAPYALSSTSGVPTALGTPAFMAPEQARGGTAGEIDGRADLWSLAAMAFTLLSGKLVRAGNVPGSQLREAIVGTIRSLAEVAPDVPKEIVAFLDRALAYDRSARFPGARVMRDELHAIAKPLRISLDLVDIPVARASSSRWLADAQSQGAFPLFDAPAAPVSDSPTARDAEPSLGLPLATLPPVDPVRARVLLMTAVVGLPLFGLLVGRYLGTVSVGAPVTTLSAVSAIERNDVRSGATVRSDSLPPISSARSTASASEAQSSQPLLPLPLQSGVPARRPTRKP